MYSSSFHMIYVIIVCCEDMIVLIQKSNNEHFHP